MTESPYLPDPGRYDGRMPYRRAGRSGVLLPALSLGLWQNFGAERPFTHSRRMLHYTFGRVMERSFRPYRDELFVSTKAGYDMWPGPYGNWGSRKYLTASLDQSLRRMKLDYVDLFYTHRFDPQTPLEETLRALVDAVRAGKALYVGISRYPLDAARFAFRYLVERDVPCLLFQDRYNLLDREPEREGLLSAAAGAGSGFIAFSPLA